MLAKELKFTIENVTWINFSAIRLDVEHQERPGHDRVTAQILDIQAGPLTLRRALKTSAA
jgi:hypothetical protein